MGELESFKALRGRPFLLNQIMRPVVNGHINHAQIFAGPRGTGKSSAAYLLAKAVSCTGSGKKPCGVCPSCLRFSEGSPAGLTVIEPDGKSIKIGQIRTVIDDLLIRPESGMKCVIIKEADRMTEEAQNSLLKTLEEPPEYALFILVTESYAALLPTIRSRCMVLRFAPLDNSEIVSFLMERGIDRQTALAAARGGAGSPGKALEIAGDEDYAKLVSSLTSAFEGLKTTKDVAKCCKAFVPFKEDAGMVLEILETCACEMMTAQYVAGADAGMLSQTLIKNGIDGADLMKSVIKCSEMLDSNVAYQSAIEMLLFGICTK